MCCYVEVLRFNDYALVVPGVVAALPGCSIDLAHKDEQRLTLLGLGAVWCWELLRGLKQQ